MTRTRRRVRSGSRANAPNGGARRWYENQRTLRAVTFPIYAIPGWPAQIAGTGSHGETLTDLTIAHFASQDADLIEDVSPVQVTTSTEELHGGALAAARRELERLVDDEVQHQHTRHARRRGHAVVPRAPSPAARCRVERDQLGMHGSRSTGPRRPS